VTYPISDETWEEKRRGDCGRSPGPRGEWQARGPHVSASSWREGDSAGARGDDEAVPSASPSNSNLDLENGLVGDLWCLGLWPVGFYFYVRKGGVVGSAPHVRSTKRAMEMEGRKMLGV
jgi:hypothetical protein